MNDSQKKVLNNSKKIFLRFTMCVLFFFVFSAYAQDKTTIAEPYGPAEFPPWISDIRRAEIISFGALPFVTFATSIYYDVFRYVQKGGDEGYLPWPVKKSDKAIPLTQREQKNIFLASVGISVGVALVDYTVRAIARRSRMRKAEQKERETYDPIQIQPKLEDYE